MNVKKDFYKNKEKLQNISPDKSKAPYANAALSERL